MLHSPFLLNPIISNLYVSRLTYQYIVELSNLFKVSTDYLLGMNSTATIDVSDLSDKDIELLHSIIQHLRDRR